MEDQNLVQQLMKWFQGLGQDQQQTDMTRLSSVNNLMPDNSTLNPRAVAGANALGGKLNATANAGYEPSWMDNLTGGTRPDGSEFNGWGGLALGAGQGMLGGWMANKQLGLAEDQFEESKRQFNKNFETNRKMTNTQLRDRQRGRVAANSNQHASVEDYMKKNGI